MTDVLPLAADFEDFDRDAWMALVDKTLKGAPFDKRLVWRTPDGLTRGPLYRREDATATLTARPAPSGDPERPWDLRAIVDHPDPTAANAQALAELQNGAASLLVRVDPTGRDGVAIADQDGLKRVLDGVYLELAPVALDAGLRGPELANALAVLAKGAPAAPLAFHLDPLSAFAEAGASPGPIESHLIAAAQTAARHAPAYPKASLFLASGRVVHEAGGTDAQELAFAAAAAILYARQLVRAGLSMADAWAGVTLGLSADARYFDGIAKTRAARAIWARLTAACEVEVPARIEARASRRMLAAVDPWTNLLRLSAAGFASGVGGADAVVLEPFTRPLGLPDAFARRQARNTQLILMEEAALGRVADPAGGAFALETLTDALARRAWTILQTIEAEGGLIAALESGRFQAEVAAAREARAVEVARRKAGLIGVSEFPNLDEGAVAVEAVDPAAFALTVAEPRLPGPDGRCAPLTPGRDAEPFEALRQAALKLEDRAEVFLATLGTAKDFSARAGFARNLAAAGGLRSATGPVDAFRGAVAVLCSSDEVYATEAAAAAAALKAAGARAVWLAGRPAEPVPDVDGLIYAGCDALDALARIHATLEASR